MNLKNAKNCMLYIVGSVDMSNQSIFACHAKPMCGELILCEIITLDLD